MTTLCTVGVYNSEEAKEFIREQVWLWYLTLIGGIAISCSLVCCIKHARVVPRNYILLFLFTCCWSYLVAGITQFYEPEVVLQAAGMTAVMTLGLTVFACLCPMKLTWVWGIAAAGTFCLLPLIFFMIFFPGNMLYQFIVYFVIILTCVYIVYDTKLICEKLGLDDYIIGALMLYMDIIQLFLWLLKAGGRD